MADQAYVYVKNNLTGSIDATRMLPDGSTASTATISNANREKITLLGPDEWVVVTAPAGVDTRDCVISVKSDVDLDTLHSRTDSNWTIKIVPNELPPTTPTDVNITIGVNEPE
jgi:hypothetical protein